MRPKNALGIFGLSIILSGAKKMFSETKHKYKSSCRKRCQGQNKVFRKKSLYKIVSIIPHTKYRTEQHNKDRGYFTPLTYQQVLLG
jgi:hypothetical protein